MKNTRITILTAGDFPYGGAPESFVRQMALGLKHQDVEVNIIRYWGARYSNQNDTNINCSNYLFKKQPKSNLLKIADLLLKIIYSPVFFAKEKHRKKTDALLIYGFDKVLFLLPVLILGVIFRIKCFRIITDYKVSDFAPKSWTNKPRILLTRIQSKYIDRYYDGIIVLSSFLFEYYFRSGVSKNKIILIKHFIDLDCPSHSSKKTKNRIGFCGNPAIKNGIIDLVRAFNIVKKKHPQAELLIIGKVSDGVLNEINLNTAKSTNINFTGLLHSEDVKLALASCNVLINPRPGSIWAEAGFPTKIGEYFSTKTPVVTTKVGDLLTCFQNKKEVVLAEPDNPESLSQAIIFLFENPVKAKEIGMNGYSWAKEHLDFKQNAYKLKHFILNA